MYARNRASSLAILATAAFALILGGCASRQSAYTETFEATGDGAAAAALIAEADAQWENRGDVTALRGAIDTYKQAAELDPNNQALLIRLDLAGFAVSAGSACSCGGVP